MTPGGCCEHLPPRIEGRTIEDEHPHVTGHMLVFDFDENERLVSIEILVASKVLPAQALKRASRAGLIV